jgi:hypothetical protein
MKREMTIALCTAVLVMVGPSWTHAAERPNPAGSGSAVSAQSSDQNSAQTSPEAMEMVPAHAELLEKIDAKKAHVGDTVRARLEHTIQLKNGPELPDGTILMGKVTQDTLKPDNVQLALRFDQAKLKNGTTVPIKTMIVSIQPSLSTDEANLRSPVPASAVWTPDTNQVDQMNAVNGADLHSRITSEDSGMLSSNKKNDVQIAKGSEVDLAIARSHQGNFGS